MRSFLSSVRLRIYQPEICEKIEPDRSQSFTELHVGSETSCVSDKQTLPPGRADTQTPPQASLDGLMHTCCGGWMKGVSHKHKLLCRMSHSYCGKTHGCWSWSDRNVGRRSALKCVCTKCMCVKLVKSQLFVKALFQTVSTHLRYLHMDKSSHTQNKLTHRTSNYLLGNSRNCNTFDIYKL